MSDEQAQKQRSVNEGGWSASTVPSPPRDFSPIFPDLAGFGPREPFQRVRGYRGIDFAVLNVPKGRISNPVRPGIPATSRGQCLYTTPPPLIESNSALLSI